MGTFKQFEDLEIWQKAIDLAVDIYHLCESSPKLKSDFSAKDNIKRASISISNNIAEGFEYNNNKQFIRYLKISKGSAGETRSQLYILRRTNYISEPDFIETKDKCFKISKQISGFIKYLTDSSLNKKS